MSGPVAPPRFSVPVLVCGVETGQSWGVVSDVSVSGMRLQTTLRQPVGSRHLLFFIWGAEEVTFEAEVVRHTDDGLAVRFVSPDPEFCEVIEELIADAPPHQGKGTPPSSS